MRCSFVRKTKKFDFLFGLNPESRWVKSRCGLWSFTSEFGVEFPRSVLSHEISPKTEQLSDSTFAAVRNDSCSFSQQPDESHR
jgi:hypothetical protein